MSEELRQLTDVLWADEFQQGKVALAQGDLGRADDLLSSATVRALSVFGPKDARSGDSVFHLARLRYAQGRLPDAEQHDRQALKIREDALGESHPECRESCLNLALLYAGPGNTHIADNSMDVRAWELGMQRFGPDSWQVARLQGWLWAISIQDKNGAGARTWYRQSLALARKLSARPPEGMPDIGAWWAHLCQGLGFTQEACEFLGCSLDYRRRTAGDDSLEVAEVLAATAGLRTHLGQHGLAEGCYRRTLDILEQKLGPDHPQLLPALRGLLGAQQALRHPDSDLERRLRDLERKIQFSQTVGYGVEEE